MAETLTYLGFIDKQIDELTYAVRSTPELKEHNKKMRSLIKNESLENLQNYASRIMESIAKTGRESKNDVSLFNLCRMLSEIEYKLATNNYPASCPYFVKFLKEQLFRFTLFDQWLGRSMIITFYNAAQIDNKNIIESGFGDIRNKDTYYPSEEIFIDYLQIPYSYAKFFINCDKTRYYNEEERKYLEDTISQYEQFRKYVDTDRKITPMELRASTMPYRKSDPTKWVYEKEALKLRKEVRKTWPALAYAISEVYYRYDDRLKIAKKVVKDNPKIQYPRFEEKPRIRHNESIKKLEKGLITLALIIGVIAFIVYQALGFFAAHPIWRGIAILVGILLIVGSSISPFGFLFLWFLDRDK